MLERKDEKMARKSNAKLKGKIGKEGSVGMYSPSPSAADASREFSPLTPNLITDVVQSLYEKNRKRVSTYYCPNTACRTTFWNAAEGYACPSCGALGLISEFKYSRITESTADRNIVGYLDTMGRLMCSNCILAYGVHGEIGLIVYDDTEPFCHEHCEMCKEPLGLIQD
jgi:hypothetical protein